MSKKDEKKEETPRISSIIHPLIKPVGAPPHPLVQLYDGDPRLLPEMKFVGIMRAPGRNTFMSLVAKIKGDKIISIEVGEPNLRAIVEDECKCEMVLMFESGHHDYE